MSPTTDKPITLEFPGDEPAWARPLFVAQYEMRMEFRRHLQRCDQRHPAAPRVDWWDRGYKVLRAVAIVGALGWGAMMLIADRAARDVARSNSPSVIRVIQSPPAAPIIIYTSPDAGASRRPPRRQR